MCKNWIAQIKKYKQDKGCTYKEALIQNKGKKCHKCKLIVS